MRIIRSNQSWRIISKFGTNHCLERLALSQGYRVAAMCRILRCSIRYFYTMFMRDIGLPPKQWMNLERMVVARRKLEGGISSAQVAQDLGFQSVHTFGRQFRKYHQINPERFQRQRQIFDPSGELSKRA